jgi:hypothetical protein
MARLVQLFGWQGRFDDVDQLEGRRYRFDLTGSQNRLDGGVIDVTFSEIPEDVDQFFLIGLGQKLLGGETLALIHPHVQWGIEAVGKATARIIELRGRDTDIHEDEVGAVIGSIFKFADGGGKRRMHQTDRHRRLIGFESTLAVVEGILILIDADQGGFLWQDVKDGFRMSGPSQRQIQIDNRLLTGHEAEHFVKHHGLMRIVVGHAFFVPISLAASAE